MSLRGFRVAPFTEGVLHADVLDMRHALASFLDYLRAECGLSEHSLAAYARDVARFISFFAQHDPLGHARGPSAVTPDHIRAFLWWEEQRGLVARSQARALVALRGLFKFLVAEGRLLTSPATLIETPKIGRPLPKVLGERDIGRLLDEPFAQDPIGLRDHALLELLYATGARASEVCGLDAAGIRLDAGFLRVFGKGRKERVVPLGRRAEEACRRYATDARPHLLKPARRLEPAFLLSRRGGRMCRTSLWRVVTARCREVGVDPEASPHVFRHSFATHLLAHGASVRSVQEMLGHASVATTQLYTHVDRSHLLAVHKRFHPRP